MKRNHVHRTQRSKKNRPTNNTSDGAAAEILKRKRRIDDLLDRPFLHHKDVDDLSIGGFEGKDLRLRVWAKILSIGNRDVCSFAKLTKENKYYDQVDKDVVRSMTKLLPNQNKALINEKRAQLRDLMNALFAKHAELHYYQGFNDICSVLLLEVGPRHAFSMAERLASYHLRDMMASSFESTKRIVFLIFPLLHHFDITVEGHLRAADLQPFFCLSWVITWFAHDIDDLEVVSRIFDATLSIHPLLPLYLSAELVLRRSRDILALDAEYSTLHHFLTHIVHEHPSPEDWIRSAYRLFAEYPPTRLIADAKEDFSSM
eukprot:TRINITY_DN9116_c0_g1_i1.p1 TRINITY_DN9116_c0_g1~~TRINITY_DN9116_c0_g1_i1.p1  ORF type:complete len:316 (-),score=63.82 TRINITY_DN9116_c0_g1_i1:598-1545(-)